MYTVEQLTAVGGSEWQKGNNHRVYFNGLGDWYGLQVEYYNSGSVSSATLDGEKISNTTAKELIATLSPAKVWYDVDKGEFFSSGLERGDFKAIVKAIKAAINSATEVA